MAGVDEKNLKVFVTGGAGFIGSHLVDRLMAEGNHVTVYDNLTSGRKAFIAQHLNASRFRFIQDDLLQLNRLEENMKAHDIVFHLAANPDARAGILRTRLDLEQNTLATYNVLESMRINGIKKLVFTSSGTVYGENPQIAIGEDYGPMLPISLYGASKLASEGLISAFCDLFGMQAWIFRLGNIVGSRATHGVIFDLIAKLRKDPEQSLEVLGDGNQTKPYVYVDDCIDGMLFCVQNSNNRVNVFNLCGETVTSVKDIARMILEKTGSKETRVHYTGGDRGWPGDVPLVRLDASKAGRLGWKTKFTSNEAVAKTVDDILMETNRS
jgi:UDP-glucose 4-epimerase